jgi:hypothetical protein
VAEIEYEWSGSFIKRVRFHAPRTEDHPVEPLRVYQTRDDEHAVMKEGLKAIARMTDDEGAVGLARATLERLDMGWS